MQILHLSDLHFGTVENANTWYSQLAEDLVRELGCSQLDALVLSGDIANKAIAEEYTAAEHFLKQLSMEFQLSPDQILIVPGNHDVSWSLAKKAYSRTRSDEYKSPFDGNNRPDPNHAIDKGESIEVPNPAKYRQRFKPFSEFYQRVKGGGVPSGVPSAGDHPALPGAEPPDPRPQLRLAARPPVPGARQYQHQCAE